MANSPVCVSVAQIAQCWLKWHSQQAFSVSLQRDISMTASSSMFCADVLTQLSAVNVASQEKSMTSCALAAASSRRRKSGEKKAGEAGLNGRCVSGG